jgi:hypothetical protein
MTRRILVSEKEEGNAFTFDVRVVDSRGESLHQVTLQKSDYERLAGGTASPATLVKKSFEFLLERETKESILRAFDLTVIGRYFPEYEREIVRRL